MSGSIGSTNLGGSEASDELLGEGVRDGLALVTLVVLEGLEASKGSASGYNLMAKAGLVLLEIVVVVDLLVAVLALVYGTCQTDSIDKKQMRHTPETHCESVVEV